MNTTVDTVTINDVEYVRKDSIKINEMAETLDGMPYVICRTYSAGVFAGHLEKREGREVIMRNARRLWRWAGAASLSQLAMEGTKDPSNCKFPCAVDSVELLEAIEIIPCTAKAKKSIEGVAIWEM